MKPNISALHHILMLAWMVRNEYTWQYQGAGGEVVPKSSHNPRTLPSTQGTQIPIWLMINATQYAQYGVLLMPVVVQHRVAFMCTGLLGRNSCYNQLGAICCVSIPFHASCTNNRVHMEGFRQLLALSCILSPRLLVPFPQIGSGLTESRVSFHSSVESKYK